MRELLGEVVTWDVTGQVISYSDVQQALSAAGLDPDAAADLSARSAFSRACKELPGVRAIDKLQKGKSEVAKFQFTQKKPAGDGTIDYSFECLVDLDTKAGTVSCAADSALERQAQELVNFAFQTRNAQDVTRLVQKLFEKHADLYPINPRKGVAYFVPEKHRSFTEQVAQFLTQIGGVLHRFPVPKGTPEGNASVKEAVQAGLATLLAELNAAVSQWDETTRQSTMDKAAEKYQIIAYKIDAYAEYLQSEQEQLKQRLEEAKAELVKKVSALKPEPEATAA